MNYRAACVELEHEIIVLYYCIVLQVTNVGWVHIEISTEAFRLLVVPCLKRNHGTWKFL